MQYPLTLPQQSIFLDSLLQGDTTKYNMGGALVIAGSLDVDLFRRSLEHAVSVHDVLRLRLHSAQDSAGGNAPMQEFLPAGGCDTPFEFFDYSGAAQPPLEAAMARVLDDHSRPMRLDQFPLHGDKLYRLTNHLHLWYPRFHHITNDAFGHSLIAATVARSYDELLQWGRLPELDGRSYADFIADDISYTSSPQFLKDSAFWRAKFPSMPEPLPFTARQCRVTPGASGTERCTLGVPRLVYDSVMRRADEAGVTAFHLLLAMLLAYLNRVTGQGDIVVGNAHPEPCQSCFPQHSGDVYEHDAAAHSGGARQHGLQARRGH